MFTGHDPLRVDQARAKLVRLSCAETSDPFGRMMADRLGALFFCLCTACGAEATVRPVEVPKLEQVERGGTATVRLMDGGLLDLSDYDALLLFPASGGTGYRLERPIRFIHQDGELWLQYDRFAPIPFDPDRYSRAVVVYRDSGRGAWIAGGAVLGGLVLVGTGELVLGAKAAR